ncbi:MAG: cobyric acid synthase, partial [Rhodoglobus sp.]|nr:cobyric acid synthase [Rhodoglobus sp.]
MLTVLSVFPDTLNMNGDAQNALVLAQRARWSGGNARVVDLNRGMSASKMTPDVIVVGSGAESGIPADLAALREIEPSLASWIRAGVPLLAVGSGWALLAETIELIDGEVLAGIGLFSGRSVPASRVSDDIVVDSEWGRLVGYENHARSYMPTVGSRGLGRVVYGHGNAGASIEGELVGRSIGTHLHGPVLAKNPALADHVLTTVLGDTYKRDSPTATRVDALASTARNQILEKLQ